MATPVNPSLIFSFRFINFILFSSSILFQLLLFGFAPLIALGIVLNAPWYFFLFLLPVSYIYLSIPAALSLFLIIFLLRFFPPKKLFQIAGALNLLVTGLWLFFVFSSQEEILTLFLNFIAQQEWLIKLLRPLSKTAEILTGLLGDTINLGRPLFELGIMAVLIFFLAIFVMQKIYYPAFDRILTSAHTQKKVKNHQKITDIPNLVSAHWKIAFRNYEMAQGALGMITIFIIYFVIMINISLEDSSLHSLFLLLNLAICGIITHLVSYILFVPPAFLTDKQAPKKQFWLLKASPLSPKEIIRSFWKIYFIPQIPLGIILLPLAHIATNLSWALFPWALVIFFLMQAAITAVSVLTVFLEFVQTSNTPFIQKFLREFSPMLISVLFLLFLGLGQYYQNLSFLFWLHPLNNVVVNTIGIAAAIIMISASGIKSLKKAEEFWERFQL